MVAASPEALARDSCRYPDRSRPVDMSLSVLHIDPHRRAELFHGEAGRRLAERDGPLGFLARDLAAEVPAMLRDIARV